MEVFAIKPFLYFILVFLFSVNSIFGTEVHCSSIRKYNLSICSIFKNESAYLREWIEFHKLVGVDHFYLYNNGSTDKYLEVLNPYIQKDIVTLVEWPDRLAYADRDSDEMWALCTQIPAYENAARFKAVAETKWLAFVDVDEFLVPSKNSSLIEVLEKYDSYPAITFSEDFFDVSSIYSNVPGRKLVIESFELTRRPQKVLDKSVTKTIFKPDSIDAFSWAPFTYRFKNDLQAVKLKKESVRMNHYVNRNTGYKGWNKSRIWLSGNAPTEDQVEDLLEQNYEIEDPEKAIGRFVPEIYKRMGYPTW